MEKSKESIIKAAKSCFARYGFSKTTLEDIGKSVGLKKNSLYHYFKNKEEIFMLVVTDEINNLINESKDEYNPSAGLKENINTYISRRLNRCKQTTVLNALFTDLYNTQNPLLNEVIKLTNKLETNYIESLFIDYNNRGKIKDDDYKMYASSILLICDSIKRQDIAINNDKNWDKQIIFIIDKFLSSIVN